MKSPAPYEIQVAGWLDASWSEWFAGMTVEHQTRNEGSIVTRLTGLVQDQALLRSILNHIFDLNLTLLLVRCLAAELDFSSEP
jgi:hypothetical protein